MNAITRLNKNIKASILAKQELLADEECLGQFSKAVEVVANRCQQGGCLFIAGNGGSAADAQHLAAEFISKLARKRVPLPAEALTTNGSVLTAIANDYGFDMVFARQLAGRATTKDVFLGITTSGQSQNILRALEQCRTMGVVSIIFCGHDGGPAKALADHCIIAPGVAVSTIQELHIVLAHTLCECVESIMFGE